MHRILMAVVIVLTAAYSALSAELPARAPTPVPLLSPASVFTWSGFYVGLNAGGAWGAGCAATLPSFPGITVGWVNNTCGFGGDSNASFIGGVQAGYNWQFGFIVAGLEADIAGLTNHDNITTVTFAGIAGVPAGNYNFSGSRQPNVFGTVRGRLGFAIDHALFYMTGGLAYGSGTKKLVVSHFTAGVLNGTWSSNTNGSGVGWTVGLGSEYAFTNNWTVKVEYLLANLGKSGDTTVCTGACLGVNPALTWVSDQRPTYENIVRVGVNYKF